MIVETRKGDLLKMFKQGDFEFIAHGCNCFNTMGSGIARQLADTYPTVLEADQKTLRGDPLKLGTIDLVKIYPYQYVVNMYTQYEYGTDSRKVEYSAVNQCFTKFQEWWSSNITMSQSKSFVMGIPMIGAGLAGGNWDLITDIINNATPHINIVLVEYQP